MSEGRKTMAVRSNLRPMSLLQIAGLLVLLSGCQSDTLYDAVPPDVEPPEVTLEYPEDGAQVQAGQRVPIRVSATDEDGVASVTLRITGSVSQTITIQFVPARPEVQGDTAIVVPEGASGTIQINLTGLNTHGVEGQGSGAVLSVTNVDIMPPSVSISVETPERMELTDLIRVTVKAFDNPGGSGIANTGLTAIVTNTARTDTMVLSPVDAFTGSAADTAVSNFSFTPPFVDAMNLPDTLDIVFFGIANDREGNCGGAVEDGFTDDVSCGSYSIAGDPYPIANAVTDARRIVAVSGRTSMTPGGGTLADLIVDTLRSRVYVSNLTRNRIHTLEADPGTWGPEVWVGAEPWGLAFSAGGDSLFVANSGGTSLSFVSLVGTPKEDLERRFVTQNNALWEVTLGDGKYAASFQDFSDRPQFIAQDAAGRILYSTRPTGSATTGTVRVVTNQPEWDSPETRIVVTAEDLDSDPQTTAIVYVDAVGASEDGSCVSILDHVPGYPNEIISSGCLPLEEAIQAVAAQGSDIWAVHKAKWNLERLALQDTTFVAASGDREWVAFGEGGTGADQAGRITLWNSDWGTIQSRLPVADLVSNASERVTGLDLNFDGSLGSASGDGASYFWSTDLRLQGSVTKSVPGGAGAALHHALPSFTPGMPSADETVAFVGQADHTIRILDTTHFAERGQIHIRDVIVGPLRAAPPLPTDNDGQGSACAGQDCVVLKLYAITDGGGVVVVDVKRRDFIDLQ